MTRPATIAALTVPLVLGGCGGWQSALDPHGPQAADLAWLFWSFMTILAAAWLITMLALAWAVAQRNRRRAAGTELETDPATEQRITGVIATLCAITGFIVLALTGLSYAGQKRFFTQRADSVVIRLTGHQWWWEARYEDAQPARIFTTANELHIPVGERVTFQLASSDVIHSFWVPNLAGKLDLIPGMDNKLQLVAERPGLYRGQCAEFCGFQHAHMGLLLVAEAKEAFEAWRERQIRAAEAPGDEERRKGQSVFLSKPCASCHAVRGTTAGGRIGPDLTHIGSRHYLASATLPLTRGTLAAWIIDPQIIKPGVHMPVTQLRPDEIDPLLSYLMGLK
jgi:cytochrome c oxidase subunit 2